MSLFAIGNQLPLFIWPAEIYDDYIRDDWASVDINLENLFEDKYSECSDHFVESCIYDGIQMPMCLMLNHRSGYPTVGNGHHRLAVAVNHNLVLPVIFDDYTAFPHDYTESDDYPNSWSDCDFCRECRCEECECYEDDYTQEEDAA